MLNRVLYFFHKKLPVYALVLALFGLTAYMTAAAGQRLWKSFNKRPEPAGKSEGMSEFPASPGTGSKPSSAAVQSYQGGAASGPTEAVQTAAPAQAVPPTESNPNSVQKPPVSQPAGCLVTVFGNTYNVTRLRSSHPGGDIFRCGTDMTQAYQRQHGNDMGMLAPYRVAGAQAPAGTAGSQGNTDMEPGQEVTVSAGGSFSPASLSVSAGESVRFVYENPGDEVVISFSPQPPASLKLDHEHTVRSAAFSQPGTYVARSSRGGSATIIVR